MRHAWAVFLGGAVLSCNDIEPRRRSTAPLNASAEFSCESYTESGSVSPSAKDGRCVIDSKVTFNFTILVNVPETSVYGAGHTFVLSSEDTASIKVSGGTLNAKLPLLGTVTAAYRVNKEVSANVEYPLSDQASIPSRAVYTPSGPNEKPNYDAALPLDVLFATSRIVDTTDGPAVAFIRSLPAGRWSRSFEPEPPYDALFPPHIGDVQVKRSGDQFDIVVVSALDDPGGKSRDTTVKRAEGLEGWKLWLADHASGQRISTLKTLCVPRRPDELDFGVKCDATGTQADTRLETVGRGASLADPPVDVVLAPPEGTLAIPRLVSELFAGSGLASVPYPELRQPIALEGIVAASAEGGTFLGVTSRVTFESESIIQSGGSSTSLLRYATTLSTDDRGRFATVMPPGTYRATVEPLEGTGFAAMRKQVVIDEDPKTPSRSTINLSPPRRTRVRGMALLTDGRPALNAEVLANAAPLTDLSAQARPRPARTQVLADGTFALDLDQGPYVITVIPEEGTGFPRVVTRATIPANEADVGVVRIPLPKVLQLEIKEPREPTTLARPIPFANVRIFAAPEGAVPPSPLLEIGSGMTNAEGKVEILVAPQPK